MTELENYYGVLPSLAGMHTLRGLRQATILNRTVENLLEITKNLQEKHYSTLVVM